MRHLRSQKKGETGIRRELKYFRQNRYRMADANGAATGFAIGSGSVEAANKVLGIIYLVVTEDRFLKRVYS